jgi:hypothetical protein
MKRKDFFGLAAGTIACFDVAAGFTRLLALC